MNIRVVTSWNNKLYEKYAHIFEETYNWNFPYEVYNEDVDMYEKIPGLYDFVQRNKDREVNGYLMDGVRFSYKVFAYTHAILNAPAGTTGIIGIDADSRFVKPICKKFIGKWIHRDDCMMTYLGRGKNYSECGFLYFNLQHPDTLDYAKAMQEMYLTDGIYKEREYHDSYIWDLVRMRFEKERGTKNHDIGDGKWGHVQATSILGGIYDHMKGYRKLQGFSDENTKLYKNTSGKNKRSGWHLNELGRWEQK